MLNLIRRLLVFSLVLSTTSGLAANRGKGAAVFQCRGLFDENAPLSFPSGWPVDPDEAQQLYDLSSLGERRDVWQLARFAEFVDSIPMAVYEDLGTIVTFDILGAMKPDHPRHPQHDVANRFFQFLEAQENFLSSFEGKQDKAHEDVIQWLSERFHGAPPSQPWQPKRILRRAFVAYQDVSALTKSDVFRQFKEAVIAFYLARSKSLPPPATFLRHSKEALFCAVAHVLAPQILALSSFRDANELLSLVARSIKGEVVDVPRRLSPAFERVQKLISEECAQQGMLQQRIAHAGLINLTVNFLRSFKKGHSLTDQPAIYQSWVNSLNRDMLIDEGWKPFLKALFVEVIMERPTLSVEQMKFLIRGNVEHLIQTKRLELMADLGVKKPQPYH